MINFYRRIFHVLAAACNRSFLPVIIILVAGIILLNSSRVCGQFLHRSGKDIVDGDGKPFLLRGMGLGGWMLQEGYMLEMNSFANPQHQIRNKIEELIGTAATNQFYEAWYANHCTRRDIDSLKAWGFNSVRLPMHYNLFTLPIEDEPVPGQNTWLEKGFAMTDSLVKWCAANSMYVILDLHAAPGGQGRDAAISDYDSSKPSLWESEENRKKTIALWRKLAERYASEKWIGGYDLINEPNWNFTPGAHQNGCEETSNAPLRKLYIDITNAIREVDANHLIFIEGNCWANNHSGLFPAWDDNMAISFHKYWNFNDQGSVQGMINLRNQHNLPLWMGESGENSNVWFTNAISILEKNNIGWAWWPMKKVGSVVCPLTIPKKNGYNTLLSYWKDGGTKPTQEFARQAMMELANDLKIENNLFQKDVIDAMFRQVTDRSAIPFKKHLIPGTIHLTDFDLGPHKVAYNDTDTATHHVSAGSYTAWNNGWTYRNDGVDIERSSDTQAGSNGFNVGWTADGEWMQYTVAVDSSAAYNIALRYAAAGSASKIVLLENGLAKSKEVNLVGTGGNQVWKNIVIEDVVLYKGVNRLKLLFLKGGANVGSMSFTLSRKTIDTPFRAISGETMADATWIKLALNKKLPVGLAISKEEFILKVNGTAATIEEVAVPEGNSFGLMIRAKSGFVDTEPITVSYNGTSVKATDGTVLESFVDLHIVNSLPVHAALPGKIEAEHFSKNVGLQLETTSDTGGGQNIGYTNPGDYLEYLVRVAETGEYFIELRVASAGTAGVLEFQQIGLDGKVLNSARVNTPVTGGWQTWQTINGKMTLSAGRSILRLRIIQPEFNLNWFKFSPLIINDIKKNRQGSIHVYPNPADEYLRVQREEDIPAKLSSVSIRNMNGQVVRQVLSDDDQNMDAVFIGDLSGGLYVIEIRTAVGSYTGRFMKR